MTKNRYLQVLIGVSIALGSIIIFIVIFIFVFLTNQNVYTIDIDQGFLDREKEEEYLLTDSRLLGDEIAPGDYSIGLFDQKEGVIIKWRNKSKYLIVLEGLPSSQIIRVMPGKSHQEKIMIPAKYPYLLNGYPKIIHLDSQYSKDEIFNKLKEFCQKNTRGEVLVVLRSEISNNEIEDLFSISGLNLLDKKPYNSYLAKPTGERTLKEVLSSLETNSQLGRMETDCSLSLIN